MEKTPQERIWSEKFGKKYTDRNLMSIEELDKLYAARYGISRTALNKEFLEGEIEKTNKILEIGCNVGNQLLALQKMNYENLWGIELQDYAVEITKKRTKKMNIIKASAFDLPYKSDYFDLVFTSGVLIHISPNDIEKALEEIHRCTKSYIWGFEYYIPEGYETVNYRGEKNLLWKTNFLKLFIERFSDLKLLKKKEIKNLNSDNLDIMYLLKKNK